MDFQSLQTSLKRVRTAAREALLMTKSAFDSEVALKYVNSSFLFICPSLSKNSRGEPWKSTYPQYESTDKSGKSATENIHLVSNTREFWNRAVEQHEEKVYRGNSPGFSLKRRDELGSTTIALAETNIDGEPLTQETIKTNPSTFLSPPRSFVNGKPPLAQAPPTNRWRENVKSPPTTTVTAVASTTATPLRQADYGATIPILPSNANAAWPPKTPTESSAYHTPKPGAVAYKQPVTNYPPSSFVPRYTPAPNPSEAISERLVPLEKPPLPEDQYEMTEFEDSDVEIDDEEKERRRQNKRIPAWCIGWIETAKTQTSIDPDTVFGTNVPKCDLEILFGSTGNAYLKARKGKRGSSGEWGMDDVTKRELEEYRLMMGHTQQLESVVILKSIEQVIDSS
jgi:hypothetical protein